MIWQTEKKFSRDAGDPFAIQEGGSRYGRLEGFSYQLEWASESFITGGEKKEVIGRSFEFKRLYYFVAVLVFFLSLLVARTAWLQVVRRDYYYAMAEGNRIRLERVEPRRGVIYDRDYRPLVRNVANFTLYVIPADLPADEAARKKIADDIAGIIPGKTGGEIAAEIDKIKRGSLEAHNPLFIADNIPYEEAIILYLESADWRGVFLSNKTRREYGSCGRQSGCVLSLSHLLGYAGKINEEEYKKGSSEYLPIDYIGKTGLEYYWEKELKGKNGRKEIEVDALGKEKKIIAQEDPVDGSNLVLSIDLDLQAKFEEVLRTHLDKIKLKKGVGIALNPNNGEVLAMVSLPAFDNNVFARGIKPDEYRALLGDQDQPMYNRAISGEYPPGSTIKPVMSAAALEEGVINEHTSVLSVGGIRIGQWFFPDWRAGGHGTVDVKRAIAESVNTFFYYIGGGYEGFSGLGIDRIVKYEKLFGLSSVAGIDLPAEADGFLPTKEWKEKERGEKWYIGDTYHVSIGQGDLSVTPLQVANYTAAIANGGKLYRPHLVKKVLTSGDKLVKENKAEPIRQNFIKPENIDIVRRGMRQTVTAGSGRRLSSLPVEAAGKTGTAQWSSDIKHAHAWFTGFAPFDRPEIAITVLAEKAGGGDVVAVPIVKDVLEWYFRDRRATSSPETRK